MCGAAHAHNLVTVAEEAIARGELTLEQLFEQNYRPVAGSNPPLFRTGLSNWADANWRPLIDAMVEDDQAVRMCSPSDTKGFLPTHMTAHSRMPTGDLAYATKHCRSGRILFEGVDVVAKASNEPYTMAVYRQEGDGKTYQVVRNVYVPMIINGRRWGDSEVGYAFGNE